MPQIFTVGHSNHTIDIFLELLRPNHIRTLVDVRSRPYSRFNPQFNRENLKRALAGTGIDYIFAGEYLGGRPSDPGCYRGSEVDYRRVMEQDWYQRAVDRLIEIGGAQRTGIMCSEENPARCHRHKLIAQTLLEHSIPVRHIRGDGDIEEAQFLSPISRQLTLL